MARKPQKERPKKPPLFNRPMTELREAFVRSRFAEQVCFWRADIEEWLAHEREAERPEYDYAADASPWNTVLASDMIFAAHGRELELLTTLATPLAETPTSTPTSTRERERLVLVERLIAMIDRTRVNVYRGDSPGVMPSVLVMRSPNGDHAVAFGEDAITGVAIQPLHSRHVMNTIFGEWLHGRPRWREARQFICDALAKDVRKERGMAEMDFDTAVAVSADGTEIVHADFVVTSAYACDAFIPEEVRRLLGTEFSFRDHKILLCDPSEWTRRHIAAPSSDYAVALVGILGACASGVPRQFIAEMADGKKILVTHPDLVPEIEDSDTPPWPDET